MKYTPPTFTSLAEMSAIDVSRLTEIQAREMLEKIRWPNGPVCPHCRGSKITRLNASDKHRDGLIQCNGCRGQFTVILGTVMQGSHITLRQWVQAFHSMCAHKKGVSALQLQRDLGLHSYKSAWHLAHRIRFAMRQEPLANMLKGTVEVNETYVGGKERRRQGRPGGIKGRGSKKKVAVIAMVERDGRAYSMPIESATGENLKAAMREAVDKTSRIMTDQWRGYTGVGREFSGGHETINHLIGQYARGDNFEINTNTVESYFALLKRGVHGTFHHISKKHMHRYCDEFSFRWSNRKTTDGQRASAAIKQAERKRLTYKRPLEPSRTFVTNHEES